MSLKMAALCPDASLETLRPLRYRGTHRLQTDICSCFHEGALQTIQAVFDAFGKPSPPKQPTFYSLGG